MNDFQYHSNPYAPQNILRRNFPKEDLGWLEIYGAPTFVRKDTPVDKSISGHPHKWRHNPDAVVTITTREGVLTYSDPDVELWRSTYRLWYGCNKWDPEAYQPLLEACVSKKSKPGAQEAAMKGLPMTRNLTPFEMRRFVEVARGNITNIHEEHIDWCCKHLDGFAEHLKRKERDRLNAIEFQKTTTFPTLPGVEDDSI